MRKIVKKMILLLAMSSLAWSARAISETKSECTAEAKNALVSCYEACNGLSDEQECRKTCRKRYQERVKECNED